MKTVSSILMMMHVIAGFLSLLLFWIPAFTRKGGINHIKIGKIYMVLMWIVVITAGILSLKNLYMGRMEAAAFLGFLTIITASPLWKGVAILNQKKGLSASFQRKNLLFEIFLFLVSLLILSYGVFLKDQGGAILMLIFGIIGVSNIGTIIKLIKNPPQKADWFIEHMKNMIISGIAAYTAFLAFGGRTYLGHIFTGYWMVVPWVAPTILGVFSMRYLEKYYMQKRGRKRNVAAAV